MITKYQTKPVVCLDTPKNKPLELLTITWVLAKTKTGENVLGLQLGDYEKMADNTSQILNYIIKQNLISDHKDRCISSHNEKVKKQND
jgi:hypothetical protein